VNVPRLSSRRNNIDIPSIRAQCRSIPAAGKSAYPKRGLLEEPRIQAALKVEFVPSSFRFQRLGRAPNRPEPIRILPATSHLEQIRFHASPSIELRGWSSGIAL